MGGIIKAVTDIVNAVVAISLTVTLIGPILAAVSEDFKEWYVDALEPVMALLGIEDEYVVSAQVIDQLVMQDDTSFKDTMTKIALTHQTTQQGIMSLIATNTTRQRSSFNSYFNYGKNKFYNGLPNTTIRGAGVPSYAYTQIAIDYSIAGEITPVSSYIKVPDKIEHTDYLLNTMYGYKPWDNTLQYLDKEYKTSTRDYNYTTDLYDITLHRAVVEVTETTITITSLDEVNDTKTTVVVVTHETAEGVVPISETTTEEEIPIGTEVDSYIIESIDISIDETVISIPSYELKLHFVVKWYSTDSGEVLTWTYKIGSGNVTLDSSQRYSTNLEMMPIVELRNNKINTNVDKNSIKYKDSKYILETLGIDIDTVIEGISDNPNVDLITNAYMYFGVDLKDTSPVVAKMLYNTFENIYDQNLLEGIVTGGLVNTSSFKATITEGNYNSTMIWKDQRRTVVSGSIGPVGTHTNTQNGASIILRKQIRENEYIQYDIIDIGSTTFVKEGGFWATVVKQQQDGGVILPISKFMINKLSPLEQLELFGKTLRLAIYSLQVTHLEWYETKRFYSFLSKVFTIVTVVLVILSVVFPPLSAGLGAWSAFLGTLAVTIAIGIGITMALKYLISLTDNPYLKALIAVVAIAVLAYTGTIIDPIDIGLMTVNQLTDIVTNYAYEGMQEIAQASAALGVSLASRQEEFDAASSSIYGNINVEFTAALANSEPVNPYIEGPDLKIYQAVALQYDIYEIAIHTPFDRIGEFYEDKYKLGIV